MRLKSAPCGLPGTRAAPLETDDPETPGAGHVELDIALEAEREGGGTAFGLKTPPALLPD